MQAATPGGVHRSRWTALRGGHVYGESEQGASLFLTTPPPPPSNVRVDVMHVQLYWGVCVTDSWQRVPTMSSVV